MNVSIIGSRGFNNKLLFDAVIDQIIENIQSPITIISGGAKGADQLAADYATHKSIHLKVYQADWKRYGKGAGMIRNTQIIEDADLVIAFWDGQSKGTLDSINKAKKLHKDIHVLMI